MKVKAVRLHAANDLRLDTFELPEIKDDEILVKVVSDSICMSTYKCAILGTGHKRVHPDVAEHPAIMGHEFAGDIVKVGKAHQDKFKPGMKFTLQPALNYKGTMWSPGYSYEFFGGVAVRCVCDNLKTGVTKHPREGEVVLNEAYESLGRHYMCAIMPTGVRKPKQKPSVEGSVGDIATAVIAKLRNQAFSTLHELNAAIDDAAVSERITAIQDVVGRILARAEEEPAVIAGLDRLTAYYLPTTVKLLDAYDRLEEEPIQGENISSSRSEIEHTLEVLHSAFEKLFDDTYQDLSLDVSADISVLHAMLAQEGLTEGPFDVKP